MAISECSMANSEISLGPFTIETQSNIDSRLSGQWQWTSVRREHEHYIHVKVKAEAQRAMEIGQEYISTFLDLLQYICGLCWRWGNMPHIYSGGVHTYRLKDIYTYNEKNIITTSHHSHVDALQPLLFDEIFLKLCKEHITVIEMITSENWTPLQKSIYRSIYWHATALRMIKPEFAVLYLIYSLESLFPSDGNNTERLSDVCAFHLRDYYKEKRAIKKEMHRFYQKRSKLCHGGTSTNISEHDAMWLSRATAFAIYERIKMIEQYPTHDTYKNFLDSIKFA